MAKKGYNGINNLFYTMQFNELNIGDIVRVSNLKDANGNIIEIGFIITITSDPIQRVKVVFMHGYDKALWISHRIIDCYDRKLDTFITLQSKSYSRLLCNKLDTLNVIKTN